MRPYLSFVNEGLDFKVMLPDFLMKSQQTRYSGPAAKLKDFSGRVKRLTGAIVCVITKSVILISTQFNISPHCSFMIQNQITCVAVSYHCYLTVGSAMHTR